MWLDAEHRWGVEGDYFDLSGKPDDYDSGYTDGYANGNPFPIVRLSYDPATSANAPRDNAVGYPGLYVGRITVDTSDYFQSAGIMVAPPVAGPRMVDRRRRRQLDGSVPPARSAWTPSAVIALHG